jgi:signal transduction histidine kinase
MTGNINEIVQGSFSNHKPFDFYHRIVRPNGVIRILHGQGEVFTDDNGVVVKMTGTGQDVTERKIAEDMLAKTTSELKQKNKELERSNSELASFSYVAGHDLQKPLRKIQLFSQRILVTENEKLSDTGKGYFRRMQSSAAHANTY